ncbi:hypothetical protein DPSP01_014135 [Paraphaeosphaeria sporulosa]
MSQTTGNPPMTDLASANSNDPPTTDLASANSNDPPTTELASANSNDPPTTELASANSNDPPTTELASANRNGPPTTGLASANSNDPPTTDLASANSNGPAQDSINLNAGSTANVPPGAIQNSTTALRLGGLIEDERILKAREPIFQVVRQAWREDFDMKKMSPQLARPLATYNMQCKDRPDLSLPPGYIGAIANLIEQLAEYLNEHKEISLDPETYEEFCNRGIQVHEKLRKKGIAWWHVVPRYEHVQFLEVLTDEKYVDQQHESYQKLVKALLVPAARQLPHVTNYVGALENLIFERDGRKRDDYVEIVKRLRESDESVRKINEALGRHIDDHTFPWKHLQTMVKEGNSDALFYHLWLLQSSRNEELEKFMHDHGFSAQPPWIYAMNREALHASEPINPTVVAGIIADIIGHYQNEDQQLHFLEIPSMQGPETAQESGPGQRPTSVSMADAHPGSIDDIDGENALLSLEQRRTYPEGVPVVTVAWGRLRGTIFYINRIGFPGGYAYRRDNDYFPDPDDRDRWSQDGLNGLRIEDSISYDRYGEKKRGDYAKMYTKRHMGAIYGVVLDVSKYGNIDAALDRLDPKVSKEDRNRYDPTPILTGWKMDDGTIVKRWETRGCFRDRIAHQADNIIYEAAVIQEKNFEDRIRRDRTPSEGLVGGQMRAVRLQSLEPQPVPQSSHLRSQSVIPSIEDQLPDIGRSEAVTTSIPVQSNESGSQSRAQKLTDLKVLLPLCNPDLQRDLISKFFSLNLS